MTQELIDFLPQTQKEIMFETLEDGAIFESYNEQLFLMSEDEEEQKAILISDYTYGEGEEFKPYGAIAAADLKLSVVAYRESSNSKNYTIYPSFVWNNQKMVAIKNDVFAWGLYSGWETRTRNNLRIHLKNNKGQTAQTRDITPAKASEYGYAYILPKELKQGIYEGHGYMDVTKKNSSATHRLSLNYTHDKTSAANISYGISIGAGSLSISPNKSDYDYMAKNINF